MHESQTVAVLGASPKPDRYSNRAIRMLTENGHRVIPVHPKIDTIENIQVVHDLRSIEESVDTLTLYVGPERLQPMIPEILELKPGRVIFNPGTESPELQQQLREAGIPFLEACTLVMLQTSQF